VYQAEGGNRGARGCGINEATKSLGGKGRAGRRKKVLYALGRGRLCGTVGLRGGGGTGPRGVANLSAAIVVDPVRNAWARVAAVSGRMAQEEECLSRVGEGPPEPHTAEGSEQVVAVNRKRS